MGRYTVYCALSIASHHGSDAPKAPCLLFPSLAMVALLVCIVPCAGLGCSCAEPFRPRGFSVSKNKGARESHDGFACIRAAPRHREEAEQLPASIPRSLRPARYAWGQRRNEFARYATIGRPSRLNIEQFARHGIPKGQR